MSVGDCRSIVLIAILKLEFCVQFVEFCHDRIGNFKVLFFCAATDTNGTNYFTITEKRYSSGNERNLVACSVYAHEIAAVGNELPKGFGRGMCDCRRVGFSRYKDCTEYESVSKTAEHRRGSPSASQMAKLMSSPICTLFSFAAWQRIPTVSSVRRS